MKNLSSKAIDDLIALIDVDQAKRAEAPLWERLEALSRGDEKVTVTVYTYTDDPVEVTVVARPTWDAWFDAPTTLAAMLPPGTMFCPTCGTFNCAAIKDAAVMCVGPAP